MARLTDIAIRNLKPSAIRREIPDQHQRGLYCIVQPTGAKTFAVRYRFDGRPRKLTLQPGISLAAARKEAADALYQVQQGTDPAEAKARAKDERSAAAAETLEAVAAEFFRRDGAQLRTARDWQKRPGAFGISDIWQAAYCEYPSQRDRAFAGQHRG
jgi:Arm DNA-binding domain